AAQCSSEPRRLRAPRTMVAPMTASPCRGGDSGACIAPGDERGGGGGGRVIPRGVAGPAGTAVTLRGVVGPAGAAVTPRGVAGGPPRGIAVITGVGGGEASGSPGIGV